MKPDIYTVLRSRAVPYWCDKCARTEYRFVSKTGGWQIKKCKKCGTPLRR